MVQSNDIEYTIRGHTTSDGRYCMHPNLTRLRMTIIEEGLNGYPQLRNRSTPLFHDAHPQVGLFFH